MDCDGVRLICIYGYAKIPCERDFPDLENEWKWGFIERKGLRKTVALILGDWKRRY